jgi:hypothetical protein
MKDIPNTPRIHAAQGRGALELQTMTMGNMTLDAVMIDDEPWFYAPSLARSLEYKDASDMLRIMGTADEKAIYEVQTIGGIQKANFINENGLLRVATRSNSEVASQFCDWVYREYLPTATRLYKMNQDAKRLGVNFYFTEAQWEWIRLNRHLMDLLPLAAAGYNGIEIPRMLSHKTLSCSKARKQINKLKELSFLPKVIEPRAKQLERRILAERDVRPDLFNHQGA